MLVRRPECRAVRATAKGGCRIHPLTLKNFTLWLLDALCFQVHLPATLQRSI